ncbi:putative nucleoporin [Helianthus annuus]|nr:putative nucleoporin [Helianthus annuus]
MHICLKFRIEIEREELKLSVCFALSACNPPKASDRAQVESKEVRLPDSGLIPLDGQDVQIALKLSDDLHLNEIDCVRLLVSTNQEWGLQELGPLGILRFTSGLWYTERRDLITALYTLLRAIVLDLRASPKANISYKGIELNREEPAGLGGPNSERYILDSRGALVERRAVVCRERLILSHCLVLSLLVVRASPKDVKDILTTLKDSVEDISGSANIVKNQITFSLLVSLIISLISDALSASPDEMSILSRDASFRRDFHETVMAIGNDQIIEGCMHCVRLAWAVHLMILQDVTDASEINNDVRNINSCLEVVFSNNVFQFLIDKALRTPAYQNDDEDMIYLCSILRSSS